MPLITHNYVYDFSVIGYETSVIKPLSGTPADSSGKLRLNSAAACTYRNWRYADLEMVITVPNAPNTGHARAWGFKIPGLGNRGRAEFVISGAVFSCVAYDDAGTEILNEVVAWNGAWTNVATRYGIRITRGGSIRFYVNGEEVSSIRQSEVSRIPSLPCVVHASNATADNMDSAAWIVKDAESMTSENVTP